MADICRKLSHFVKSLIHNCIALGFFVKNISSRQENLPDTVTVNVHVTWLPERALNVYVTVVTPRLKLEPDEAVDWRLTVDPELSVAVGSIQVAMAPLAP